MNTQVLLDSFSVKGNTLQGFETALKSLSGITSIVSFKVGALEFLSTCDKSNLRDGDLTQDEKAFFILTADSGKGLHEKAIQKGKTIASKFGTPELLKELDDTTQLIVIAPGEDGHDAHYLVSQIAIANLLKRLQLGGEIMIKHGSLLRNLAIADAAGRDEVRKDKLNCIVREINVDGNVYRKIFAAMGDRFVPTRSEDIIETVRYILDNMSGTIDEYHITQELRQIKIDLPAINGISPGLIIRDSDVLFCSYTLESVLSYGNSYVVIDSRTHMHSQETGAGVTIAEAEELLEALYPIIKQYDNLSSRYIIDYDKIDVSKERGGAKNLKTAKSLIEKVAKIKFKGVPIKTRDRITEALADEINSGSKITLKDIAYQFLAVPGKQDETEIHRVTLDNIRKSCMVADILVKS